MKELEPCPVCGGEAEETVYAFWHAGCPVEGCAGFDIYMHNHDTEAEAIAAWNTRAERTCRNISGKNWWAFECSECGEMIEQGVPEYCPSCGAKAVSE